MKEGGGPETMCRADVLSRMFEAEPASSLHAGLKDPNIFMPFLRVLRDSGVTPCLYL